MAAIYPSTSLQNKEVLAVFGNEDERYFDEESNNEDSDLYWEGGDEGKVRSLRRSSSLEIFGLRREQSVYFSNQEYYRRLEELKAAHLRNMKDLERMYISQRSGRDEDEDEGRRRSSEDRLSVSSGPIRKLQRINSQEELDLHDSSSDQSELCGTDSTGDLDLDLDLDLDRVRTLDLDHRRTLDLDLDRTRTTGQNRSFRRDFLLNSDVSTTQKPFGFSASRPKAQGQGRSSFKVTVPKPFQMMVREEERKKHKVRSRSEIELENSLLRRELEELQECQKKFRASPAPAHIHLPLYQIISRNRQNRPIRSSADSAPSPQPFHFLERERRKREARIEAELGKFGPKEERRNFKAKPMPSSVYGNKH